jgi:inorganic pyrophosphatase
METHKALPHNPILQDFKGGALRAYPVPLGVSYGALPQTYEFPSLDSGGDGGGGDAFTGLAGDGDPLDALDLSSAVPLTANGRDVADDGDGNAGSGPRGWGVALPSTGDVYPVRVIGALAMVDGGEADWKLLAVRTDDPLLGGVTGAYVR